MASVISKRKGNKTYYYVVTSARVNGQPRITNQRNRPAQRGHNKQGRHNLRQVGLSYVLDGNAGCYGDTNRHGGSPASTITSSNRAALDEWMRKVEVGGSQCISPMPLQRVCRGARHGCEDLVGFFFWRSFPNV